MPQLKTKGSTRSGKTAASGTPGPQHPEIGSVHELIGRMQHYEQAARTQGIDLASGRFKMLTNAERQFHRAEMIADYLKLTVANLGETPSRFESSLETFCAKVCEMQVPSMELIGTYLAAVEIASEEERLRSIPGLEDALHRTFVAVLEVCAGTLGEQTSLKAAA